MPPPFRRSANAIAQLRLLCFTSGTAPTKRHRLSLVVCRGQRNRPAVRESEEDARSTFNVRSSHSVCSLTRTNSQSRGPSRLPRRGLPQRAPPRLRSTVGQTRGGAQRSPQQSTGGCRRRKCRRCAGAHLVRRSRRSQGSGGLVQRADDPTEGSGIALCSLRERPIPCGAVVRCAAQTLQRPSAHFFSGPHDGR